MIKLTENLITYIKHVTNVANQFDIDTLIIEPNRVRAMDLKQSAIILHDKDVPDLPCTSLCITRVKEFSNRLELVLKQPNPEISIIMSPKVNEDGVEYAETIIMKAKGIKTDFRCGEPKRKMAPKQINDPFVHQLKIMTEITSIIQSGKTAMATDDVIILGDNTHAQISMRDTVHGDVLTFDLDAPPILLTDVAEPFRHVFSAKLLLTALKTTTSTTFTLSQKGFLKINFNGVDVVILPKE